MFATLLALQWFHVLFLGLHDWVPLGRLNDLQAVHRANTRRELLVTTLVSTLPFAFVLTASMYSIHHPPPHWLGGWLWGCYGVLLFGELQAWWFPYFFGASAARVARYQSMFGRTTALLPARNGIQPNTLHVVLHLATVATLVLIAVTPL